MFRIVIKQRQQFQKINNTVDSHFCRYLAIVPVQLLCISSCLLTWLTDCKLILELVETVHIHHEVSQSLESVKKLMNINCFTHCLIIFKFFFKCNAGKTGHFKLYTHWTHFSCILCAVWSLYETDCVLSGGLPPGEIFVEIVYCGLNIFLSVLCFRKVLNF